MVRESRAYFQRTPLLLLAPGLAIALTLLCANLLGNALRDRVDVVGPLH